MKTILIAEDELNIAQMVSIFLHKNGYSCRIARDGSEACELVENHIFDLVLLDVMLPEIDGFELIGYFKQYNIPVIFVTAKTSVADRVKGLKLGADDYILKPFDLSELLARIETVLRRYKIDDSVIKIQDLEINIPARSISRSGHPVSLSAKEFDLLLYFITNNNIALSREMIYENVWKEPYLGNTRTVDLHVQRLKKKTGLEKNIQSIYKIGYIFKKEL